MEATGDLRSIDSVNDLCSETKIIQDFITQMKLSDDSHQEQEEEDRDSVDNHEEDDDEEEEDDDDDDDEEEEDDDEEEEDDDDDDDEEEEEFTFMFEGANTPSMEAEDMKQVFPLFNRDVFFSGEGLKPSKENLPTELPVKKVFVETDKISDEEHLVTSVSTGSDEVAGPFCEWSGSKAVVASSVACKKSNSTGFSKFWRFKDLVGRSCSDGKDTFVFLNKSPAPPRAVVKRRTREVGLPSPKTEIGKVRRIGRGKTAPLSAHAVYLKNKAKQEDRRRSYLPYRPELMGFFTNSNVGLTRNVHPY